MKKNVLLIDDDKELSEEMSEILETEGYNVQTASDGEKGEHFIRKSLYDIILIDFKLPGITGVDLFRKVMKLSPDSKFFFISGRPFIEKLIKEEGLSKMVSGCVAKPFDMKKLLKKIRAKTFSSPTSGKKP